MVATDSIKPGDCFFNVARFSCIRIRRVNGEYADAMTWRPDGSKGSNIVKVRVSSLTKLPYWRMEAVRVLAGGKLFEFELLDKEYYP